MQIVLNDIIKGALVSGSLIVAIGAQNLFVLKQGLLKNHIFFVSLICFLCDIALIYLGIFGIGTIINEHKNITVFLSLSGCVFLLVYAFKSFKNALSASKSILINNNSDKIKQSLISTIVATLGVTLLNPHVYLDTVVIIGGVSGALSFTQKINFFIGSSLTSFIWFFALGYGSHLLIPLFKKKIMWVILDTIIGFIMLLIALSLMVFVFHTLY